jgi:hypothetical protein
LLRLEMQSGRAEAFTLSSNVCLTCYDDSTIVRIATVDATSRCGLPK